MTIWAIADLHLSFAQPERQHREHLAERWRDHAQQIDERWHAVVRPEDLVLIPGDLSMARNHRDLQPDLAWLDHLPGTKVLSAGNHDRWWNGVERVRPLLRRSERAVGGDALATHGVIVCGTRGIPVLSDPVTPSQRAAAERELGLLDQALEHANQMRQPGQPLYVLWHYPPFDTHRRPGPCVNRFETARVTACVYGHTHTAGHWALLPQGTIRGVRYSCVAADAIGFQPLRIDREPAT